MSLLSRALRKGKKLVLVVDDEAVIAKVLVQFIQACGYEVVTAEDGYKCIELIHKDMPDLILLDIMMPKMNGFDTLLKIKSQPETKHIPVIMCTAENQMKEVDRCSKWGAVGYIIKPFDLDRVAGKLKTILSGDSQKE